MVRWSALMLLGISLGLVGCSPKAAPTADVSGKVTLDEKPLPDGEIYFITMGMPPEILPIKDGAFAGKAKPGQRHLRFEDRLDRAR